ncbi:MAG TPA: prenyltransferase/squalene oxidase repeat-containing protein [Actinomycetota bacterium]|nr:prenyltransferase/squalene oxidase repeat-containing protein [Actinomycetota bacterium]
MPGDAAALLERCRNPDGGFGPRAGEASELEPTALAAMALADPDAKAWLAAQQRENGSFAVTIGPYVNDSSTGLCALALETGPMRESALDYLEETRARRVDTSAAIPIDPSAIGWGWTRGSASWVEPTARALWALRVARPSSDRIDDAVDLLRDRACVGGGWNYGNREVLGEELTPFAQTTAIALVGLQNLDPELEMRGLGVLRRLWRVESAGGLSLATAVAAFRTHGASEEAERVGASLRRLVRETGLLGDGIALGWAALATSDRLPGIDR